ncbi:nucleotidyl transferase AbiEii/AbiGii toxin family protein [Streptomyces sp. NPDC127068]|uniref:nucleotidyl transferase AbiEii/AbiGii toxin family protein n=1 Tax=Streptomyces sp. NPDC127068 TaxID=3347127 RepID=UPI0036525635
MAPTPGPAPGTPYDRLLPDLLAAGRPHRLALTGGWAARAHGLVARASRDVDLATASPVPLPEIAADVRGELERRGWTVRAGERGPLSARFTVEAPVDGATTRPVTVDLPGTARPAPVGVVLYKEALWHPPVATPIGLALALEDLTGTKVRALADRGLARDLVHVHAVADRWSRPDLEELGRRHAPDTFDPRDLQARLSGAEWMDEREFRAYGIGRVETAALRAWAQEWGDEIAERLVEGGPPPDDEA